MLKFRQLLQFLLILTGIVLFEAAISSCASRSSPTGGPRDTIAPNLDTSFPANLSTNFNATSIELIFDEYISLKNPNQQIIISPPLKTQPDIDLKGKRVIIGLKDTLLENTTYTISFGSAITDFTEGNINKGFKYIFSTGTFIDSLKFKGHIVNSTSNESEAELFVALYEVSDTSSNNDSLAFKNIPTYYTFTDESGHFEMDYLKNGSFILLAFDDPQADFKLNGNEQKVAFASSYIQTSDAEADIDIFSFPPTEKFRYFGGRHKGSGRIQFGFNMVPVNFSLKKFGDTTSLKVFPNETGDSLTYWFKPLEDVDSLTFLVSAEDMEVDTTVIYLREYDKPKLSLKYFSQQLKAGDTAIIISSTPLVGLDTNSFTLTTSKDTSTPVFYSQPNPFLIKIQTPSPKLGNFSVMALRKAANGINGSVNDSTRIDFKRLKGEDLGNLDFKVIANTQLALILEILDARGEVLLTQSFTDSTVIKMSSYIPGKYSARLIMDKNEDGEWTTGNFFEKRQPERVIRYQEEIEIRANWDLELEWNVRLTD